MATIELTLQAKDDQDAFDKVVRHLAGMTRGRCVQVDEDEEGWRGDTCQYFIDYYDGSVGKCAIGAIIDQPALLAGRFLGVGDLIGGVGGFLLHIGDVSDLLLVELQNVHDDEESWYWGTLSHRGWECLVQIAWDHDLNVDVVAELIPPTSAALLPIN